MNYRLLPLLVLLSLHGCNRQPAVVATPPAPPLSWQHAPTAATQIDPQWWRGFTNPELNLLVDQALRNNDDLAAAVARIRQAEAGARMAGAPLLPQLDGQLGGAREGRLGGSAEVAGTRYSTALAASYEVDLWGRLSDRHASTLADVRASQFDRATLQVTLSAGVVSTWLQQVGLHQRLRIAGLNLANAERVLATVEARQRAGAGTSLELAQQRGVVAEQRRAQAEVRQQVDDSRAALAVLLGLSSGNNLTLAEQQLASLGLPSLGAGVPSELLVRRPDIARAEARLAAADADVLAARAALLPQLKLSAGAGGSAGRVSDVLANPLYSLAAALTAPIFDGGFLNASLDLAGARREELLADYRSGIVAAFADVQLALNAQAGVDAQLQAQLVGLEQAELAFRLSETRYHAGAQTLLELLDTQRTLYAAQDDTVRLQLAQLQARVALYRALGGGWPAQGAVSAGNPQPGAGP